jgi:HAD superfamily hydrolase (TIGR01509 family)
MFDGYLKERAQRTGEAFKPFDEHSDYDEYVDGLPRDDGVRSFLKSRGIELPDGKPDDRPDAETVAGLGIRKNEIVQQIIKRNGVEAYPGSVRYVKAAREAGLDTAVVSSSANTAQVLKAADIADLFKVVVDGRVIEREKLPGKPKPDTFLHAGHELGAEPKQAVVFEDALSGVQAGRDGHFGYVVGVDRVGQADELKKHGADVVVKDLAELLQ